MVKNYFLVFEKILPLVLNKYFHVLQATERMIVCHFIEGLVIVPLLVHF